MVGWQGDDGDGVLAGDGEFEIAVIEQAAVKGARVNTKIRLPQAGLDGDLPQAGGAEEEFIAGSRDQGSCFIREANTLTYSPEQKVGVE